MLDNQGMYETPEVEGWLAASNGPWSNAVAGATRVAACCCLVSTV
jgi:hypothetical protein